MKPDRPRVLVTGGAGYIGAVLTPRLLEHGYGVTVLDAFRFGQTPLVDCCRFPRFEVVRGDCRDERLLAELLPAHDVIIPLAAIVGAPACAAHPVDAVSINRDAIASLCRLASASQRILLPVTNSGYGVGEREAYCTEESPLRPQSLYAETKIAAERIVLDRGGSLTLRLATVFGASPRMRTDLLVNDFVFRALTDGSLVLFEGHFRRNFIHVADVARVFLHGIEHFETMQGRAYNVGRDDANLSKRELCETIRRHIPGFTFVEAPVGRDPDQRDYIVSNARILATGFRPERTLDDGIVELIKAYRIVQHRAN